MISSVLDSNKVSNSQLQIDCILLLNELFINDSITNLVVKSYFFEGVRGEFYKLENYCICFDFTYFDYSIEFDLSYDQLEYYITKKDKLIKERNLEDFWGDKIMIEKFIIYLKKDLVKLEIPFNDIKS
ncbi:hypothetical protein [Flavobacterium gyeonganense]|uniref:Uncharacterized protein n=1 Tax=Flavobacterium gyeonganense TaxID=1310418 RepID=A0ABV5HD18_9FLAO|nr:hypothetical protein [Flavobacterium gyeonganense]